MGGQGLEPEHLDPRAVADETVFAEDGPQIEGFTAITPVDGGNGGEAGKFHGMRVRVAG